MNKQVDISICIPAYKNIPFLTRLLDSIAQQSFSNYEVIITDDTPDDSVSDLIKTYNAHFPIHYYHNTPSLGTPENWNEAIRKASGKWIKLMHNDDYFTGNDALARFHAATIRNPECSFFFAAFQNRTEKTGATEVVTCNFFDRLFLRMSPLHLFKRVYVGNPSCTLVRREAGIFYDNRFKFVVDFEYYIRCIRQLKRYQYIDEVLLNIGFHDEQVTEYTFGVAAVQIPENFILIGKMGQRIILNPFVYDYYWRMFRNLGIRTEEQVKQYYTGEIPSVLRKMLHFQSSFSSQILKKGVISKMLMSASYVSSLFVSHRG